MWYLGTPVILILVCYISLCDAQVTLQLCEAPIKDEICILECQTPDLTQSVVFKKENTQYASCKFILGSLSCTSNYPTRSLISQQSSPAITFLNITQLSRAGDQGSWTCDYGSSGSSAKTLTVLTAPEQRGLSPDVDIDFCTGNQSDSQDITLTVTCSSHVTVSATLNSANVPAHTENLTVAKGPACSDVAENIYTAVFTITNTTGGLTGSGYTLTFTTELTELSTLPEPDRENYMYETQYTSDISLACLPTSTAPSTTPSVTSGTTQLSNTTTPKPDHMINIILGAVGGVILFITLIAIIVYYVRKRRTKNGNTAANNSELPKTNVPQNNVRNGHDNTTFVPSDDNVNYPPVDKNVIPPVKYGGDGEITTTMSTTTEAITTTEQTTEPATTEPVDTTEPEVTTESTETATTESLGAGTINTSGPGTQTSSEVQTSGTATDGTTTTSTPVKKTGELTEEEKVIIITTSSVGGFLLLLVIAGVILCCMRKTKSSDLPNDKKGKEREKPKYEDLRRIQQHRVQQNAQNGRYPGKKSTGRNTGYEPPLQSVRYYPQGQQGYPHSQGQQGYPHSEGRQGNPHSWGQQGYPHSQGQQGYPHSQGQQGYPHSRGQQGYPHHTYQSLNPYSSLGSNNYRNQSRSSHMQMEMRYYDPYGYHGYENAYFADTNATRNGRDSGHNSRRQRRSHKNMPTEDYGPSRYMNYEANWY